VFGHVSAIVLAIGCIQISAPAMAQGAWRPAKAVELIVPTAPGGANDLVARAMQLALRENKLVTSPVEVMNKPGGNQSIAVVYLNQHPADAHYLLIANPTLIGSHIAGISTVNYTDLTPIALLMSEHTVFSVPADSPIKTAQDMFDRLKANPDALAIGVVSRGGPSHLALSASVRAAGIDARKLKTIVFKTNAESLTAMVGGHIHVVASSVSSALGHFSSGKTRILGVVAAQRMSGPLANVPTLREQGIDVTQASWRVVFAPKGIAAAQLAFWEDALGKMVTTAEWQKTIEANNWASTFLRGKELDAYLESNYQLTKTVMDDLGMATKK
jgi:putative tricarboxylic transport membrane protein